MNTLTDKFLYGRNFSYNYLLKSLRVAIATNNISLNFPHKDVSLRNWWYLSIPQLVLINFGLDKVSNTSKKNSKGKAGDGEYLFHSMTVAEIFWNGRRGVCETMQMKLITKHLNPLVGSPKLVTFPNAFIHCPIRGGIGALFMSFVILPFTEV
jgi:hypothetical protein